jgi:GT2 family glycosyltransferase
MTAPRASVVVVNRNTRELLLQCLRSIRDSTPDLALQIVVVDNGSSDGSADAVGVQHPDVTLVRSADNLGFARGNNLGFAHAAGRYIVLLNSDTMVLPGAIQALLAELDRRPEVGIVGGQQLDERRRFVPTGCWFPSLGRDLAAATGLYSLRWWMLDHRLPLTGCWFAIETREVDWLGASFVAVRRDVIDQVGGLPEEFFMYGEDVEWCWRIKQAGWRVLYLHGAPIIHLEGRSANLLFKHDKGQRLLDGFWRFARAHRHPVGWRVGWLALATYWSVMAARWAVRARLRKDEESRAIAASLRSYVRRHLDQVLGRIDLEA